MLAWYQVHKIIWVSMPGSNISQLNAHRWNTNDDIPVNIPVYRFASELFVLQHHGFTSPTKYKGTKMLSYANTEQRKYQWWVNFK